MGGELWSMVHGRWSLVDGLVDGRDGTESAFTPGMKAKKLEDVVVYLEACQNEDAVSALLERPSFNKDSDLKDQLSRSSSRIGPLISEGYGQLTDRHLAVYLGRARGSALETNAHLRKAHARKFISSKEFADLTGKYTTIVKRLTRWINYLDDSDWKNRG